MAAIFARFAVASGADVFGLLTVRFTIATAALAGVARWRSIAFPPPRRMLALAAMGGIGYTGQAYCYFAALDHAQASLVSLLLYTYPVLVAVLASLFLKERLTTMAMAALILCSVGTALTVGGGQGSALGISLGLGAAVIYSIYIVVGTRVTRGIDPIACSTVICSAAAVVYVAVTVVRHVAGTPVHFPGDTGGWIAVIAIALVSTVVAILSFLAGLQRLGATRASMLSTLEPVVTVALAALLLGESMTATQLVGGALILGGVLWLAAGGRQRFN
jgi:drug/metabolite transporter (DMT)-like permease